MSATDQQARTGRTDGRRGQRSTTKKGGSCKGTPRAAEWRLPKVESKEALIRTHTGEVIPEDVYQRRQRAERSYQKRIELAIRVAQSEHGSVGTGMKLNELHWVGLCSGLSQKAPTVPRRMVVPEFASKNRNETMTALAYYLTQHPGLSPSRFNGWSADSFPGSGARARRAPLDYGSDSQTQGSRLVFASR